MTVLHGDCLELMPILGENSVDSIVTDPPYGLSFMGKDWDHGVPGVHFWQEALKVLKPGGYLLAFGGTRTFHRLACAIEDAGFEMRDTIMWVYGSGFPKSLDVSKAIDKAGGKPTPPGFAAWIKAERETKGLTAKDLCERGKFYKNINHGGLISNWESGLGFPNAEQFNLLCDLLELPFDRREEVQREVLGWRQVAPGVAFSNEGPTELPITIPATDAARQWEGWGTALKPAYEPIIVARKPLDGTVAANVLKWGTGGLNIDGCRVGDEVLPAQTAGQAKLGTFVRHDMVTPERTGRWPANLIHDGSDEVLAGFPDSKGQLADAKTDGACKFGNVYSPMRYGRKDEPSADSDNEGAVGFKMKPGARRLDSGSAARFFYCSKASKADRDEGLEAFEDKVLAMSNQAKAEQARGNLHQGESGMSTGKVRKNNHPTVKPTDLMRYLCRLVTPPGGLVLNPFTGSGSTGKAAKREGFSFIGIELQAEYVEIAKARIA